MTDDDRLFDGHDSIDIDIADDPESAKTVAVGMTVSASEKVSTGDYENYSPHETLRAAFVPAIDITDQRGRTEVRKRALRAHHDIQQDLDEAIDQRLRTADFEDWPEGVEPTADDGGDD